MGKRETSVSQSGMCVDVLPDTSDCPEMSRLGNYHWPELQAAFALSRRWYEKHWFAGTVLNLKRDFYLSRMAVSGPDADRLPPGWLDRFARQAAQDWLVYSNAVCFWFDNGVRVAAPTLLPVEACHYTETPFGSTLKFESPWKRADLPDGVKQKFSGMVTATSDSEDIKYRVLSSGRPACGFGPPDLFRAFRVLSEAESLEVGQALLAYCGRTVIRQHLLGHDPKSSQFKSKIPHYYTKERAAAVEKTFRGKVGFVEAPTNHDHEIKYVVPASADFSEERFASVIARLANWSGPAGHMLLARGIAPFLLVQFREEARAARLALSGFLKGVIAAAYGAAVEITFGDSCFKDPRLALQMLQAGLSSGPLSQTTFLEECEFDPEKEKALKLKEAAEPDEAHLPLFDASHGTEPTDPTDNGRPPGTPDPAP